MKEIKGSRDGMTWEEKIRKEHNSEYNRFSNKQYIENLKLLSKWCERKIIELKKNENMWLSNDL